jgi:DNA-binding transcriptional LysR family regulator
MAINLNQLRAFHAVVKTGTFSRAAEELFVTEPAVFIQVRSLERASGFKLLDKFGKDLSPTEVGKLLFEYADRIFGLVEDAEKAMQEVHDLKSGNLRLGTAKALAQYLMPVVVSSFRDRYPKIMVHLDEGGSHEIVDGVMNQRFELGIVARVPYPDRIDSTPFSKDEVLLVVSPKSRLLGRDHFTLEDLNDQPVICRDVGSATRHAMWDHFEQRGLKPSAVIEAGNTEFIKNLVKKNKGYSFLASLCVREEIERGELVSIRVNGVPLRLDIDVIHLKGKTLSPAASTFLAFLQRNRNLEDLGRLVDDLRAQGSAA